MSLDTWIEISFIAGFIPVFLFFLTYAISTRWPETVIGRVIFTLSFASTLSYGTSVAVLLYPEALDATHVGVVFRIVLRFVFAGLFWAVLIIFWRYQYKERQKLKIEAVPVTDEKEIP